jgi:transcriptional regulator with XRE-family HTH domain
MTAQPAARALPDLFEIIRLERRAFAAKMRLARAVLGWSQSEFGFRVGLTQRAIHKLEQGDTEPRRATLRAIEEIWREQNIEFEDLGDGGFRVTIRASVLERPVTPQARRHHAARLHLGVTAIAHRPHIHRS